MTRRPSAIPTDSWPPRMLAELAAGYVGEKHVEDFLARVGTAYPHPRVTESKRRRFWYRRDLDKALGLAETPTGMGARFSAENRKKRSG